MVVEEAHNKGRSMAKLTAKVVFDNSGYRWLLSSEGYMHDFREVSCGGDWPRMALYGEVTCDFSWPKLAEKSKW